MKKRSIVLCTVISGIIAAILLFVTFPASAGQETHKNSIGMEFVLIPSGSFMMGAHEFEKGGKDEKPRHKVTISKAFFIGRYEVTQEQWMAVMGSKPSKFQARKKPVEQVSWDDVQEFIRKLNRKEGTDRYRLPTEAEWEYAARAGSEDAYCYGDDPDAEQLHKYAWYDKNSGRKTKTVGKLKPNAWGLYDMHGNVWEWCQDLYDSEYDSEYYANSPSTNPKGPSSGSYRVFRGGSWLNSAWECRSAHRYYYSPDARSYSRGFRLARSPGQ